MLVEIHLLQNHAPANLNRDDTGSPKDCIFGGVRRSRISSQCLKRSIRMSPLFAAGLAGSELAVRTRRLPARVAEILSAEGFTPELAAAAAVKASGFGTKEGKERPKEGNTAQTMFLTENDVRAVAGAIGVTIREVGSDLARFNAVPAKDIQAKASLRGWRPITTDIALFGRMTTSEAFKDIEAAAQVAHAISTNKMDHEFDYFVAVDDLQTEEDEESGADMIGDTEFNSACYYKYFALDYDGLVKNLAGPGGEGETMTAARQLAADTIPAFLRAAVFTTPTGKQNSFAAHQLPDAILVEVRPHKTEVSYANAFVKPARPQGGRDLVEDSIDKFAAHVERLTRKFSLPATARFWFTTGEAAIAGTTACETLDELLVGLGQAVAGGE